MPSYLSSMIAFSLFSFESFGSILPLMRESKQPEKFKSVVISAIICLTFVYSFFSIVVSMHLGDQYNYNLSRNLDDYHLTTKIVRLLNIVAIALTYPLTIHSANLGLEKLLFYTMKQNTSCRKWLKNFSRILLCSVACILSILFDMPYEFFSKFGALLAILIILIIPSACHMRICQNSKNQDLAMITLGVILFILYFYNIITK